MFRKQPQNVDEIGEANRKHEEFENCSPEMITMFENADKKNKILSAWSRENVEQVSKVTGDYIYIIHLYLVYNLLSPRLPFIHLSLLTDFKVQVHC